ncbi:MAG: N-acetylmuramoyl-L-alanine amidase [Lachnospiraceae bacterium]|nr:N-acetylmuramoyl-L-alanine amidase [Lachnospiraceae bacterium]
MVVGVNCGHTKSGAGYGAVGIIKESEHTRLVGQALMSLLRSAGVTVVDCTIDQADTQNEYLAASVALANRQELDWFISIHFNASGSREGHGTEVYTYEGRQYQDAVDVCANLSELGFANRGVKAGTGLYVIRKTKAKSMLIEVCFCDNQEDVSLYQSIGAEGIAKAIYKGIYHPVVLPSQLPSAENHNLTREEFHAFVGEISRKDWQERRVMLPSVVIAQASIESTAGTSELAQNANALFGIKQNGWTGRTYVKDATEQNPDGSYRVDKNELWRAYDSWEQSILDHNAYIATRSTDGGRTLRYGSVIGCHDYILACQYLQQCGYATSQTYAETLINYIERYHLHQYDEFESEQLAPEGFLWIVQAGAYKSLNNARKLQRKLEKLGVASLINKYRIEASE